MTDAIRVHCLDGLVRTFAWAQSAYGIQLERAEPNAEGQVYRVIAYIEKEGPCGGYPEVFGGDPLPIAGLYVAAHWPSAPQPPTGGVYPDPIPNDLDWVPNYVIGRTDANGVTGFGWDSGNCQAYGEPGAFCYWVRGSGRGDTEYDEIPSDFAKFHGWRAGTNHRALHPRFLLVESSEPEPEPTEERFVVVDHQFQPSEATNVLALDLLNPGEIDFLDTVLDVRIRFGSQPGPPWDYEYDFFAPYSEDEYIVELPYIPGESEQSRQFWFALRHAGSAGIPLSAWHLAEWQTDGYGVNRFAIEWGTEEPPPGPEPEPPPGPPPGSENIAELFLEMSDLLVEMGRTCYRIAQLFGSVD